MDKSKNFKIVGGERTYLNPRLGRIDLTKPFTDNQALEWYKDENFPYIKPTPSAVEFLSKESPEIIKDLIDRAKTHEEKEILQKCLKTESKKTKVIEK